MEVIQNTNSNFTQNNTFDVIIIGSGISGLSSADKLLQNNFHIKILEARQIYGGRISKNESLANFAIDTGGEEVHCKNSAYYELVQQNGGVLIQEDINSINYIECPDKQEMMTDNEFYDKYPELDFISVAEGEYQSISDNVSVSDYLEKMNLLKKSGKYFQNLYGNENGTKLSKINLKGLIDYDNQFETSDNFIISNMSHFDVITKAFSKVLTQIQYNTPVQKIDYSFQDSEYIHVISSNNESFYCKQILITVPLSQLKNNSIQFVPQLSQDKIEAIKKINMGISGKLQTKFKERFWQNDFNSIILQKEDLGMTWNSSLCKDEKYSNILTTLVVEDVAIKMNDEQIRNELIQIFLQKLAVLFKNEKIPEQFEGYIWTEYSSMKYIEGSYTTPTLHLTKERSTLAEPINNKVFFAGEATSLYNHSTIHGAYETGLREAENIINSNNK